MTLGYFYLAYAVLLFKWRTFWAVPTGCMGPKQTEKESQRAAGLANR